VSLLIMLGDSAYFTYDYLLAESYYRKALQLYKSLSKSIPNLKEALPEDCSNGRCNNVHFVKAEVEVEKSLEE
jgi:hypothetical protein